MQATIHKITNPTYTHYLTLKAPATSARTPVHIIAVIDTSGSMDNANKLENVKKSIKAMLDILTDTDIFSLVTFSRHSQIIVQALPATLENKYTITTSIESMEAMGSTNLSAGLLNAFKCSRATRDSVCKTSVILLTDGEANEGVKHPDELIDLIHSSGTPHLSIHTFGYGHDHNKEILGLISDNSSGGYNVVNNLDDVATSIGNAFGSIACCVAQGVTVHASPGIALSSGFLTDPTGAINIGDMIADNEIGVLVRIDEPVEPGWNIAIERYDIATKKYINVYVVDCLNENPVITKKAMVTDLRLQLVEYIRAPPAVDVLMQFIAKIDGIREANMLDDTATLNMLNIMKERAQRLMVRVHPLNILRRGVAPVEDVQFFRTMRSVYSTTGGEDETGNPVGASPGGFMRSVASPMVQRYTQAVHSLATHDPVVATSNS
jgi:uncharacterized protein YegL